MHPFSSLCTFTRACQDSDPQLHAATAAGGEARILKTQWPSLQELTLTLIACSQQVWAPVGVPLLCRKISLTVSFQFHFHLIMASKVLKMSWTWRIQAGTRLGISKSANHLNLNHSKSSYLEEVVSFLCPSLPLGRPFTWISVNLLRFEPIRWRVPFSRHFGMNCKFKPFL